MTLHICINCTLTHDDCGPWDDQHELFKNVFAIHHNHPGFQIGTLESKKLSIEVEFDNYFNSVIDEMLHQVISDQKGFTKSCLVSHKSWREIENWEL